VIYREALGAGSARWLLADIARPLGVMLAMTLIAWPFLSAPAAGVIAPLRLIALGAVLTGVSAAVNGVRPSLPRGLLNSARRRS